MTGMAALLSVRSIVRYRNRIAQSERRQQSFRAALVHKDLRLTFGPCEYKAPVDAGDERGWLYAATLRAYSAA
jgi:hypothetical protein